MSEAYDLAVVGGGSAGVWAAPFAARLGARVALVEKARIGGDCTHSGCVPSKALLKAAGTVWHMRTADRFGVDAARPAVDLGRVMRTVRAAIERVYQAETPEALASQGVAVLAGAARFLDPHTIEVGGATRLRARHVLLCTGARPALPGLPGLEQAPHWTYQTVWQQTCLPGRLLVIGSGPVGIELAQAFARLGAEVTVFVRGERPLRLADPEASAALGEALAEEGVRFRLGARPERVRAAGSGVIVTDRGEAVAGDALLVATGRRPVVQGLGLEQAGVAYSERGIQVDEQLRTTQKHIFACGDVAGGYQFTHYAAWQAAMAVRSMLLPGSSRGIRESVPWTVFTEPEVAQCGLTEREARAKAARGDVRVARWPLEKVDRAITDQDRRGFIKVVHEPGGEILGAQIVAARAGEMIHEFALAIGHGLKLADVAGTLHVYPTYSIGAQQLAAEVRLRSLADSAAVKLARAFARLGQAGAAPRHRPG